MSYNPTTSTADSCSVSDFGTFALDLDYFGRASAIFESPDTSNDHLTAFALNAGPTLVPTAALGVPNLQNVGALGSISVSTAFPLGPVSSHHPTPFDLIVLSSDHVFFGVHSHCLLAASANNFSHRLPTSTNIHDAACEQHAIYIASLPEDSVVLNVVLHTIYNISCAHYSPPLAVLGSAIAALKTYAIPLAPYLARNAPLYTLVLSQAPLPGRALEAFALAAENALEDLAVAISPYVLGHEPEDISDAFACRIGGVYMKRLYELHQRRFYAMRALVADPPFPHAPSRHCTPADRQSVARSWMLAAAQLVWEFKPDMSSHAVRAVMGSLSTQTLCPACRESLAKRTNEIAVQWSLLDRTI